MAEIFRISRRSRVFVENVPLSSRTPPAVELIDIEHLGLRLPACKIALHFPDQHKIEAVIT
jgi:hypothetical protein